MADQIPPDEYASLIEKFCVITGVDNSRAQLYLESSEWNFPLALSTYFETEDNEAETVESSEVESVTTKKEEEEECKKPVPSTSSRVATFATLLQSEDQSDEEGQAFYAGGSVRSGQQVLGPGKSKKSNDIVEEMFKAAKSHGAEVVEPSESGRMSAQLRAFRGTGHVLGTKMDDSDTVHSSETDEHERPLNVCLRAWRTGFAIDDGPLREYTDPHNKEFLDAIRNGEIPQELICKARGSEVSLNIEDHRHEDYVPPKQLLQAFTGTGHRLGSPTPPVNNAQSLSSVQNEARADEMLNVDDSAPIISLQVRLANGCKLVLRLNTSHTVGDIRRYIVTARPEYSAFVFSLLTGYPQKELTEDCATVEEANLENSVIVQKLQ